MSTDLDKCIEMKFSWLEDGFLVGCRGPRCADDLAFLALKGIKVLVRLEYEEITGIKTKDIIKHGMEDSYKPTEDMKQLHLELRIDVIKNIFDAIKKNIAVAVSCNAGYGRTGTILACYLVAKGLTAEQAIEKIISLRPLSEEILRIPGQKEVIQDFARKHLQY